VCLLPSRSFGADEGEVEVAIAVEYGEILFELGKDDLEDGTHGSRIIGFANTLYFLLDGILQTIQKMTQA
jgi:hypothetical protein